MRNVVCALMMILIPLTGCGGGEQGGRNSADELALNIRAEFLSMTSCSATVDLIADYGQRVYEYTLAVSWTKDGETVLTVIAPEKIAGITARIKNGSTILEYEGASLETGMVAADGLSPMEAIPAILDYIMTGFIAECGFEEGNEGNQLWICCRDPENPPGVGTEAAFWFDSQTHSLKRAEVMSDGYSVIQCVFREFTKE